MLLLVEHKDLFIRNFSRKIEKIWFPFLLKVSENRAHSLRSLDVIRDAVPHTIRVGVDGHTLKEFEGDGTLRKSCHDTHSKTTTNHGRKTENVD